MHIIYRQHGTPWSVLWMTLASLHLRLMKLHVSFGTLKQRARYSFSELLPAQNRILYPVKNITIRIYLKSKKSGVNTKNNLIVFTPFSLRTRGIFANLAKYLRSCVLPRSKKLRGMRNANEIVHRCKISIDG